MSSTNDLSKSTDRFNTSASGIKYFYKSKRPFNQKKSHKEFYQGAEHSVDIEIEENPEISGKFKNPNKFRPNTKQTVDQNEYKKMKKKSKKNKKTQKEKIMKKIAIVVFQVFEKAMKEAKHLRVE